MSILSTPRARILVLAAAVLLLLIGTTVLAAPYGSRTLHTGRVGGDVMELQRRLSSLGYEAGLSDGIFGPRTRSALIAFQLDYGMVPDGMAGKWTFRAVDRAYAWKGGSDYSVRTGDSLWRIAEQHGTTIEGIIALNQLYSTMLFPGQHLRLPVPPAPSTGVPVGEGSSPPPRDPGVVVPGPGIPGQAGDSPGGPGSDLPGNPEEAYMVLGYYAEDWKGDSRSLNSLKSAGDQVDLVVNFELLVDARGEITARGYPELMAEAATRGIEVQGLLHNLVGPQFDADVARSVLSNPTIRAHLVDNLVTVAAEKGLSGINVDIENIQPNQRDNYTAFVRELSTKLKPLGLGLTLSIPAKIWDAPTNSWSGAFDYKALGQIADHIIPMTYDEHSPGFPEGPVASIGWVERVIIYATSQMPAEKILLGIPAYGYDWPKGGTQAKGLSAVQAPQRAAQYGSDILWDDRAMVPYFRYWTDGIERIVYYENVRSLAPKLDLVIKYGLGGIGIWRMGLEDPGIWDVIETKLR